MGDTILSLNLNINPQEDINDQHDFNKERDQGDMIGSESRIPMKNEETVLMEELQRTRSENKKLTEMLIFVCENYNNSLRGSSQPADLFSEDDSNSKSSKKRKGSGGEDLGIGNYNGNTAHEISSSCGTDIGCGGGAGCCKRTREIIKTTSNVSKVYAKTPPSDTTLIVKDGYQWRKYGQKVTRDNPSPRAYYKCSFAPNCPVKKKVQRSVEDPTLVVAIYEGEHNHLQSNYQVEVPLGFNQLASMIPCSVSSPNYTSSSSPRPNPSPVPDFTRPGIDMLAFQQLLVEKMADSLTRNPSFTTSLAAAISTRILDHELAESWENTT